jgi:maltokinase
MSEGAARTTVPPCGHEPALLASLDPLLRQWLPRQRWFAGRGRPPGPIGLESVTQLLPGAALLHVLVRVHRSPPEQGPGDCYQLLLGADRTVPLHLAPAVIGRPAQGVLSGLTVYDALQDPRRAAVLLERLRTPGPFGALRFHRGPYGQLPGPTAGLPARALRAEQSNSSVIYGDRLIAKFFRRVHPGPNPDLELPLALARAGCTRVPVPVAWFETYEGGEADGQGTGAATLGVVTPYVRGAADGWTRALQHLSAGADFTAEARELGRATAEVHAALADALPTVTLTRAAAVDLAAAMTRRLDATARQVPAVLPYVPAVRGAFAELAALADRGRSWRAQRVHGDLHLGQFLRGPSGRWQLIDFEGEPARPVAERRRPHPAQRDVAGMLRSFDYAARSHRPYDAGFAGSCRAAYCEGYAAHSGHDPRAEGVVLRAYELDKAVYECLYEAHHRPTWLRVPLAALASLPTEP